MGSKPCNIVDMNDITTDNIVLDFRITKRAELDKPLTVEEFENNLLSAYVNLKTLISVGMNDDSIAKIKADNDSLRKGIQSDVNAQIDKFQKQVQAYVTAINKRIDDLDTETKRLLDEINKSKSGSASGSTSASGSASASASASGSASSSASGSAS